MQSECSFFFFSSIGQSLVKSGPCRDCVGALQAGLQAGLVQRSEKAHPNVSKAESNPNVRMFTTLEEVARLWLQ